MDDNDDDDDDGGKKAQQITHCPILFRWISKLNGVYVHLRAAAWSNQLRSAFLLHTYIHYPFIIHYMADGVLLSSHVDSEYYV